MKLYCNEMPGEDRLYWWLDQPRTSPLYFAKFSTPDQAHTAMTLWEHARKGREELEQRVKYEQCEGFSNKETWAVALHLDNNKWMQEKYLFIRDEVKGSASRFALSLEKLVELWRDDLFQDTTGFYSYQKMRDIRNMMQDVGSLWRVSWKELAEHLLKD